MTPDRWKQVRELFERTLAASPEAREQALTAACDDPSLLGEVESLLAAHDQATGFLKSAPSSRFDAEPLIGRSAGQYQIQSMLGMGGMGIVYRAFDTQLDRHVALKVLPSESASAAARDAFVAEAKAASALNHPNIVAIYNTGSSGEIHYIAMELVQGKTLAELIRGGALPIEQALNFAIQIASALDAAHGAGIVHRDIKPGNIMVSETGFVKVLDFGLVSRGATSESPVRGTVSYMSPEQAEGKSVDARSDLFSFGCTFYEMLTGRRASSGVSSSIPASCRALIRRCLDPDPGRRVQSAQELVSALRSIEQNVSGRGSRRLAGAFATLAVAGAVAAIFLWPRRAPAGPEQWVQLTRLPDSVSQPALSPDGRKLTFVRGPNTFAGAGQIYVKPLPDGDAIQLTHDNLLKMSPVFSPDGSRIVYSTADRQNRWDTWSIASGGGEANLWLRNAEGLTWFRPHEILFSEIKDQNIHMAIVAAAETRAAAKDVYVPAETAGMAHRSYASPDGKWVLLVEMDAKAAWLPCRLVPMDGSSAGRAVGPAGAGCTFAAWSPNGQWMYMSANVGGVFHTWRQKFPDGQPEQVTSGPTEEEGIAMAPDGASFITAVALRQGALWLHDAEEDRQLATEGYSFDPKFASGGRKLCYRILKGNSPRTDPSELRVIDLDSGRSERLLPGIPLIGGQGLVYDVSADGQEVVAGAVDRDGKRRLSLARIDRSSPPQQIPNVDGDQPLFFKSGDILLRANGNVLHRVRRDGTGLRKLMDDPTLYRGPLSPDEKWIPVRRIGAGGYLTDLWPLEGRDPIHIAPPGAVDFYLAWPADGKQAFLSVSSSVSSDHGRTYAIPLSPGKILPPIPAAGFRTEAEIAALPGARRIESLDLTPGPTPGTYAFARETLLRNLYRIPIR